MDVHSYDAREETMALLKLLALGHREKEAGLYKSAEDVFRDLDALDR